MNYETPQNIVLASPEPLYDELEAAVNNKQSLGAFLVSDAIGEGDPSRDISADKLYIAALMRIASAEEAIRLYQMNH